MKPTRIIIFLLFLSFAWVYSLEKATAQNCSDYQKKCQQAPREFSRNALSRAFSIRKMKKIALKQTFFGGREYYISICGKSKLGKIHFRLLADNTQRDVLYDNAADNFKNQRLFQIDATLPIIIEVTAPYYFDEKESECAGIVVGYRAL